MSDQYWKDEADSFDAFYDKENRISPKALVSRFLNARTELLSRLVAVDGDSAVLDVGCGSGIHAELLSSRCKIFQGIDSSSQMIAQATRRISKLGIDNCEFQVGNAQDQPFADNTFDWAISMGLLDYVPSPLKVLEECSRILKPHGYIVFTIPKKPSIFAPLRTRLGNCIKRKVFDLPPIDNVVKCSELDVLSRAAGFQNLEVSSIWSAMWIVKAKKR